MKGRRMTASNAASAAARQVHAEIGREDAKVGRRPIRSGPSCLPAFLFDPSGGHVSRRVLLSALLVGASGCARMSGRVESAAAFFVSPPQSDLFGPGGDLSLRGEWAPAPIAGAELAAGLIHFVPGDQPAGGRAFTLSAGGRLRPLAATSWDPETEPTIVSGLWVGADGGVAATGGEVRPTFSAGIGLEAPVGRVLRVGPFVRYAQVLQPNAEPSPTDAKMLLAGVSASLGTAPRPRPTTRIVAPSPPPEPAPRQSPPPPAAPATSHLVGSVLDADRHGIAGARVRVVSEGGTTEVTTGGDGGFEARELRAGRLTLSIAADGHLDAERTVDLPAGQTLTIEQVLERALPQGQIRGVVSSLAGAPLEASITVQPIGLEATTDAEGAFEIDVPPGAYTVVVRCRGYRTQERRLRVEENGVTVLNADLQPLPGTR
ncbi:MAG: carboxypeptidase regulatory-like domain-containing protein [Deltaproteobacteria bacterium]|nr:carboxypeptidase regulatory-like domain-containing protein [Deltaproteobacteria bacterium]